jgi:UrcA family protein
MNKVNFAAAGLALALTAIIVPATAFAQREPITVEANLALPVEYVSYSDLNLANAAGLDRLRGRVRNAAENLCIDEAVRQLEPVFEGRRCVTSAVAGAEAQISRVIAALDRGERLASNDAIAVSVGSR